MKTHPRNFLPWGASKFCQSCGLRGFVCLYLDKSIGFVSKVLFWLFPLALGSAVFTQNMVWAREVAFAQRAPSVWGSSCLSSCEAQEKVLWARSGQEIKLLFPPEMLSSGAGQISYNCSWCWALQGCWQPQLPLTGVVGHADQALWRQVTTSKTPPCMTG